MKFEFLRHAFKKVASQLPVIGPHAGIEGELMLAGKKPMTWMSVDDRTDVGNDEFKHEQKMRRLLDKQVEAGKLVSVDVIYQLKGASPDWKCTTRHYAKREHKETMETIAGFNDCLWNNKQPDEILIKKLNQLHEDKKDIGIVLGYRKRDVMWWQVVQGMWNDWPKETIQSIYTFNEKFAQPAYQEKVLKGTGFSKFKP